jgi:hypothetical protein
MDRLSAFAIFSLIKRLMLITQLVLIDQLVLTNQLVLINELVLTNQLVLINELVLTNQLVLIDSRCVNPSIGRFSRARSWAIHLSCISIHPFKTGNRRVFASNAHLLSNRSSLVLVDELVERIRIHVPSVCRCALRSWCLIGIGALFERSSFSSYLAPKG